MIKPGTSFLHSTACLFTDFTNCYDEYDNTIFFDKAHITDFGYKILSQKIGDLIIENQLI